MIHRALLGSFERFIGILIEHYAGEFPLWLAPVQALVLPIADRHAATRARSPPSWRPPACGSSVDDRTESVGSKIREARAAQGALHADRGRQGGRGRPVSVRRHREGDLGALDVDEFVSRARSEIDSKK